MQPNHCTLLKMNVVSYRLEGKRIIEAVFGKSKLADPARRNQDSMALSDNRGNDNFHFQTVAESEEQGKNEKGTS